VTFCLFHINFIFILFFFYSMKKHYNSCTLYFIEVFLLLFTRCLIKLIGPLIDKEITKKKWPKKIDRSFCFHYLCLSVYLFVSALQVTVFVVGIWFMAWGFLKSISKNAFFCFSKFWNLTYLWLFLAFFGVFPSLFSIKYESACRSNQTT